MKTVVAAMISDNDSDSDSDFTPRSKSEFESESEFDTGVNVNIIKGLIFVLGHLDDLWPKTVSTHWTVGAQVQVSSINDALYRFCQAKLLDCKIGAYPVYTDDFRRGAHDSTLPGGHGITPSLLFIDLDKGVFDSNLALLKVALFQTLRRINEKFHGKFKPTIIWSGNGYHVYLPVQLSGPSWCLAHTDTFHELSPQDPDRKFLQWVEQYLSDGKADPAHSKAVSFKNMMLRIPGSINSKNSQKVKVLQKWDGQRPYINWILRDFRDYLIDKKLKPKKKRTYNYSYNYNLLSTKWGK